MIITTSQKASSAIKEETKELAKSLDLVYLNRQKRPISELLLEDTLIAVVSSFIAEDAFCEVVIIILRP